VLRRNALSLALLAGILALIFWSFWPSKPESVPLATASVSARVAPPAARVEPAPLPVERSALADELNSSRGDIAADLHVVLELISAFRTNFPRAGNPVGSNAEITAALSGRNALHVAFIAPDHAAINRDGELCDRWGTPFFFHAESGTRMSIQSAGPDKKMHTADDSMLAP
jgi:hypothetical protein